MHAAFTALGRFTVRFRWLVLAAWVVGAVAAIAFLPSLSSVAQNDNSAFLPAGAPSAKAAGLATAFQRSGQRAVPVLVARSGGPLTAGDATAIQRLGTDLRAVPAVTGVRDVGRSPDGEAEQLQVLTSAGLGTSQQTLVAGLRSAITRADLPSGLQAHLAGQLAINVDNNARTGTNGNRIQLLSVLVVVALLLVVFRSVLAPLVALVPAFLVAQVAGPVVAEIAQGGRLAVSGFAQLLMLVLVIGAGTDYGLFLVFRVREELRAGRDTRDAVARAVARVGESIAFSAGTVIAALLSLTAASFGLYADLGVPLAIGIGLMLLAGLTLLPALLAILGRAVFWPSRAARPAGPAGGKAGLWGRVAARVVGRPVLTLAVGLVVFGALAAASLGYQPGGFNNGANPPAGSDSAAGTALLADHFPKAASNPTGLVFRLPEPAWDDPAVLADAQRQLAADRDFTAVTGPLSANGRTITPDQYAALYAKLGPAAALPATPPAGTGVPDRAYQAYRASGQYLSADGRTVEYAVLLAAGPPTSTAAMRAVPAVRAGSDAVARTLHATDHGVVGQAASAYDISSTSDSDLGTVVPIAVAVIALLLALVMRSLVAPLYLIASVVLSYLAALGLSVLIFTKLGGESGLTFIMPFLMFVFLLALGEDYNILVMTRIREETRRLPLRRAVARALTATGTTVTSAGLVLAGTFAVFAIAGGGRGSEARDVGVGLALGILMDTFLLRTLLVPSLVVLLGRWNWWPSRLSRRSEQHLEGGGPGLQAVGGQDPGPAGRAPETLQPVVEVDEDPVR